MVHHHIQQHGDIVLLQGVDRRQQLRFIAIFGGDRALLIKLAEVEEIVGVIADGITARGAFVGGGNQTILMPISFRLGASASTSRHSSPPAG
jgi:hypothetical protein